jgi:glycosyltransferase involved in cell wall biosynthesis
MSVVAHVVVAGEIGGAEHMLRSLATDDAGGSDRHVVCVFSPNDDLPRFFREAGVEVHDGGRIREHPIAYLRRSLGPRDLGWLVRRLRMIGADVVHLHTFASQVLGTRAALRARAAIVRTEHSTRAYDDPTCWPFSRWSLRRSNAIVAISEHVRAVAVARAPFIAPRIRIVPNGVDTTRFAPGDPSKPSAFTFAIVARLDPRKGIDRLLHALAQVPDARLEIVGDGEARVRLARLAGEIGVSGRTTFHGYLPDPRPVLHRAHAAVAASRKEGLGIAFLEAMATGLPLVAVPTGGLVEIVRPGETGLLAATDSEMALAAAMRAMAAEPERARLMGIAARSDVEERFSLDAMRRAYAEVYARVAPVLGGGD